MVLVDASVWSIALRRQKKHLSDDQHATRGELESLVRQGRTRIIGPIRQELLTGVRGDVEFERLRASLATFVDEPLTTADYEHAAAAANTCIARGIAVSNVDLLICAVVIRRQWSIYTLDKDFLAYARCLPIRLHPHPSPA